MIIRALKEKDMEEINVLHDKYFSEEFQRPGFEKGYFGAFTITDDDGKIVMAGGVRPIAETVLVTDKSRNPHMLGDALLEALSYSIYVCRQFKIEDLHAFVKDEAYAKHLIRRGFSERPQALFLRVTNNG